MLISYYDLYRQKQGDRALTVGHMAKYLEFVVQVPGGGPVLDFGCGWGQLLEALQGAGVHCEGVDVCREQVEASSARGCSVIHVADSLSWLRASIELRKTWSTIFLMDVLEHFTADGQMELIPLLYDLLPRGGRLILKCPNPDSIVGMRMACIDFTHRFTPAADELAHLLRVVGFNSIRISDELPWAEPLRLRSILMLFGSSNTRLKGRRDIFYCLAKKLFRWIRRLQIASEIGLENAMQLPLSPNYLCIADK